MTILHDKNGESRLIKGAMQFVVGSTFLGAFIWNRVRLEEKEKRKVYAQVVTEGNIEGGRSTDQGGL